MKVMLFQNSSTQRVSASRFDNGDWLLSKEWRKTSDNPWVQGKGILIPKHSVEMLATLLNDDGDHNTVTNLGLEYLEEITF